MPYSGQLAAVRSQISDAKMKLEEKREELKRLQDALSELTANKSDFISKEGICLEPGFSLKTFHGENADAEGKISDKIEEVEAEIESLELKIATLEGTYAKLLASQSAAYSRASGVSK